MIYAVRGVAHTAELSRALSQLLPVEQLGGAQAAAQLLAKSLLRDEKILVVGDFDCDGATASALAVSGLRAMGCQKVGCLVPNRFEYGYGLTPEIVALAESQSPQLILTVDNGISSLAGVAAAKRLGIQVVITDHHLPGAELPDADAIVNPNLPGDLFPSKAMAGVGVMFYVLAALRAELRQLGWFAEHGIREPNLAEYLDLVALGTVADVVPLDANNRVMVHQGLARVRAGRARPGIEALFQVAGRDLRKAQAQDLGYFIGPRLNAAGRLDDMSLGIECLLAKDKATALQLALRLDQLNRERRQIEDDMREQAETILDEISVAADGELPWGLCLYDPAWHQGVIGILASRIKEKHQRPVILFADGGNGQVKGSGRSIPGFHIRDALDEIAANNPGLIQKFGGHAMAAGLSLEIGQLGKFMDQFDLAARRHLHEDQLHAVLHSDGGMDEGQMSLSNARLLAEAGPWGQGFPEPLFDGEFQLLQQKVLQDKHLKLVVRPLSGRLALEAIGFNLAQTCDGPLPPRLRLAYRLDENCYLGESRLQLRIEYWESL